jgi:hypothetical protein
MFRRPYLVSRPVLYLVLALLSYDWKAALLRIEVGSVCLTVCGSYKGLEFLVNPPLFSLSNTLAGILNSHPAESL